MKQLYVLFFLFLISGMLFAQTAGIPFQAYIIDAESGNAPGRQIPIPLVHSEILLQFEIRNSLGLVEYVEQKPVTTDAFGMLSTVVGLDPAHATFQTFDDIFWDGLPKKLITEIDFSGTGNQFEAHQEMPLIYIPGPSPDVSAGMVVGAGAPTATNPPDPKAGAVYIDDVTGEVYTFNGADWTNNSVVMSTDAGNILTKGTDNLALLDITSLEAALGFSSGIGAPTAVIPPDPEGGDIYIDETTGNIYACNTTTMAWETQVETLTTLRLELNNGPDDLAGTTDDFKELTYTDENGLATSINLSTLVTSEETLTGLAIATNDNGTPSDATDDFNELVYTSEAGTATTIDLRAATVAQTLTALTVTTNDNGSPTDLSDDFDELTYTDENGNANVVDTSTLVKANNGLTVTTGTVTFGGALVKPTSITTTAVNTLSLVGLETADLTNDNFDIALVHKTTGLVEKTPISTLIPKRYVNVATAADGDTDFTTPQPIVSLTNIDVYRNGIRVNVDQVDATTIKLSGISSFAGDEIRIVQLQ